MKLCEHGNYYVCKICGIVQDKPIKQEDMDNE